MIHSYFCVWLFVQEVKVGHKKTEKMLKYDRITQLLRVDPVELLNSAARTQSHSPNGSMSHNGFAHQYL